MTKFDSNEEREWFESLVRAIQGNNEGVISTHPSSSNFVMRRIAYNEILISKSYLMDDGSTLSGTITVKKPDEESNSLPFLKLRIEYIKHAPEESTLSLAMHYSEFSNLCNRNWVDNGISAHIHSSDGGDAFSSAKDILENIINQYNIIVTRLKKNRARKAEREKETKWMESLRRAVIDDASSPYFLKRS